MTSKSYTKDDLKRLMQEKKLEKLSKKRIDSPFASYDQNGDLFCKVCEIKIHDVILWTKHLISKEHKLSLDRLHKGSNVVEQSTSKNEVKKRKLVDEQTIDKSNNNKQMKLESFETSEQPIVTKIESSDSDRKSNEAQQPSNDLPKGFFDNPEEDAKARDEIYKDPLSDEWSKFQKIIQTEDKVAEDLNESDHIEAQAFRELNEIDEQMQHWTRINQLEIKRDALKNQEKKMQVDVQHIEDKKDKEDHNDAMSSDDDSEDLEDEFNILSNWRFKKKV